MAGHTWRSPAGFKGAAGIRSRWFLRKAADRIRRQGLILNAQIRPYRSGAAAASDDCNGRGVDHGRGYNAAPGFRQGY
jgi:hypothetical protein